MATSRSEAAKERRRKWGHYPSRDVDVPTALHLFEWSHYRFARSTEALSASGITSVLDALSRERPRDPAVLFLRAAVDARALEATWRPAVNALKQLQAGSSWGSKEKRARLTAIAHDARLLSAIQSATVASLDVPAEFLAVLVIDGSDESTDAVLPHFDRATRDAVRLEKLSALATFARGKPQYAAMLEQLGAKAAAQQANSAALALGKQLGIATTARFRVQLKMEGTPRANVWCDVRLDSGAAIDVVVWLSTGVGAGAAVTHFTSRGVQRDELGLGACPLEQLPAWLQRAERELGLRWNRTTARASYLKGQRLAVFLSWLFSS